MTIWQGTALLGPTAVVESGSTQQLTGLVGLMPACNFLCYEIMELEMLTCLMVPAEFISVNPKVRRLQILNPISGSAVSQVIIARGPLVVSNS